MSDIVKQVKVDNWGVYFLQRLKHFFNRTDYCDLTLQFQDNAQLKVHRLVLSACTEYFELLERTCEMYEDCLVMPDDLQADVVVPIVNFMYTGQLEFKMDLFESLYQTSQIMNMPVLTKLLEAHRPTTLSKFVSKYEETIRTKINHANPKRSYSKSSDSRSKPVTASPSPSTSVGAQKRSFQTAFSPTTIPSFKEKEKNIQHKNPTKITNTSFIKLMTPSTSTVMSATSKKGVIYNPRPTRYELPEELETDNIFDDSFTNISYTSQPLITHPDAAKHCQSKRSKLFTEASSSKGFAGPSTVDIVECKKISGNESLFEEENNPPFEEEFDPLPPHLDLKTNTKKVSNQLFDQILDNEDGPKVTIETKDSKQASNIDHAKIISEVLKKYPHLVKSNKNIKLKILDAPTKSQSPTPSKKQQGKRQQRMTASQSEFKIKEEKSDFTYESEVLNSQEAARLIALGAENIKGPWICLICGAPGKALNFTSYYKFRRHLVEVHNEKPVSKICEYCGLKSLKRNYLLHHMYTKHGVPPPPPYHFPKCNQCSYIALTEGFLVKHKLSHTEGRNFRCNVCSASYSSSANLLSHIQSTGHKYSAEKKINLQCIYCLKVFLREPNLYAHLKTAHKELALNDGIIEESDEEESEKKTFIKYEPTPYEQEEEEEQIEDTQYQIQQRPDGNIQLIPNPKKQMVTASPMKQKILNTGLNTSMAKPDQKVKTPSKLPSNEYVREVNINNNMHQENMNEEEIVVINNSEYIMKDNQLIPKRPNMTTNEYIVSDMIPDTHALVPASVDFPGIQTAFPQERVADQKMVIKKGNQSFQIVVSNEEEYKALMNSNHSIIFDDGDANKTLTVLSTPHSSTMNTTTIDLDNTQSSDMMIIQDPNYPLAVSESIPGDNSNIVVVYSHPVHGDDKQYQLIAPQDLGAQFVHTSAVITPNYETAVAPVMTTQVVQQHVPVSWHTSNLIQNNQAQIEATELQNVAIGGQQIVDNLSELPDINMASKISDHPNQLQQNNEDFEQANNLTEETANITTEQPISESIQNETSTAMDVDTEEKSNVNENIEIVNKNDSIPPNISEVDGSNVELKTMDTETSMLEVNTENDYVSIEASVAPERVEQQQQLEQLDENNTENQSLIMDEESGANDQDATIPIEQSENNEHDATIEHDTIHESEINSQDVSLEASQTNDQNETEKSQSLDKEMPLKDPASAPKLVEHIKSLALEWSEDEEDTEKQAEQITDNEKIENTEPPKEPEQSVETIQEEMNRQQLEAEPSTHSPIPDEQETTELNAIRKPPPEKISSLLNDWDDNESQESQENETENAVVVNENVAQATEVVTEDKGTENGSSLPEKEGDKIKSLVSDWDEEEEDKS